MLMNRLQMRNSRFLASRHFQFQTKEIKRIRNIFFRCLSMGRSSKPQERVCYSVLASQDNRAHINCEITSKHRPELIANFLAESSGKVETNWFTGKRPIYGECPGVTSDGRLHSLPFLSLEGRKCTKRALQDYFDNTWTLTELLFSSLKGEKAFIKPPYHDLRHPMIFYYGHPAALYVNKLRVAGMLNEPINPYFEVIFETGVDEMSWDDLSKNQMKWPSVQEVHHYRKQVYNTICTLIGNLSDEECQNINQNSPLWSLVMSFEHERIHIETSSVLINEMPLQYLQPPGDAFPKYHPSAYEKINITDPAEGIHFPQNYMIEMKAQNVQLGKPKDHPSFGWDNEYGSKTVSIPSFKASAFKVSNGEYLEFVKDGGYQLPEYWSEKGWEWKTYRNAKWPTFWSPIGPQGLHQFHLRCLFDLIEMKWNWPVCVNYHEAEAFANWKAKKEGKPIRVSTELEYQAIRKADQASYSDDPVMDYSEKRNLAEIGINANMSFASMSPVDAFPPNAAGFYDIQGNAWEWQTDYFSALPGFQVHPYYEDFSSPCFDGLHNVIQGCSFISTGNEASVFSRYHFRPHFFQHASFRLVECDSDELITSDMDAPGPFVGTYPFRQSKETIEKKRNNDKIIETERNRNLKLLKHYVPIYPEFAAGNNFKTISLFKDLILSNSERLGIDSKNARVIEVGCGVGGLAVQLADHFGSILGIEHNAEDISVAKAIISNQPFTCYLMGEGETKETVTISLPKAYSNIHYRCADPLCMPAELEGFDIAIISDIIDQLPSPNGLLARLGGRRSLVKTNGLLVITSAFQWKEETTPKSLWLGGLHRSDDADSHRSIDTMVKKLSNDFILLKLDKIPIFYHETRSAIRGKLLDVAVFQKR